MSQRSGPLKCVCVVAGVVFVLEDGPSLVRHPAPTHVARHLLCQARSELVTGQAVGEGEAEAIIRAATEKALYSPWCVPGCHVYMCVIMWVMWVMCVMSHVCSHVCHVCHVCEQVPKRSAPFLHATAPPQVQYSRSWTPAGIYSTLLSLRDLCLMSLHVKVA